MIASLGKTSSSLKYDTFLIKLSILGLIIISHINSSLKLLIKQNISHLD